MRTIAYIDGFNLYFGIRSAFGRRFYWLDVVQLMENVLRPGQHLLHTHYFTARIRQNGHNVADVDRQNNYLDALLARPGLSIHEGHFLQKTAHCNACGATWPQYEEKMTDVNIAVQLLSDAFDNLFDVALVVSGDSDLTTPIRRLKTRFPSKKVVAVFPPRRHSNELMRAADAYFAINEIKLRHSLLPDPVVTPAGIVLRRPATWR